MEESRVKLDARIIMTKRAQLKEHIHTLEEIGDIMTAMKNLALIEINKINKFLSMQEKTLGTIKDVGEDFFHFYPQLFPNMQEEQSIIYVLIGSERGFCGGFNENIINFITNLHPKNAKSEVKFIVIGHKLATKFADDKRIIEIIEGPDATEEIPNIISKLTNTIEKLMLDAELYLGSWSIIFCEENQNTIQVKNLQPFYEFKNNNTSIKFIDPVLNLTPEKFLFEFINHYLFSTLYLTFYKSFIAENYQRLRHLDNALDLLQKKIIYLTRNMNLLRQEEITQEIEIIMLSAQAVIEEIQHTKVRYECKNS